MAQPKVTEDRTVATRVAVSTTPGLNDLTVGGTFTGTINTLYRVVISDETSTPETFDWYKDNVRQADGVAITGSAQTLDFGVQITFLATTGHTKNDSWLWTQFATTGKEIRRVEPRAKARYLDPDDIIFATIKDSVYWIENLLINTAPIGLASLDVFYIETPTKSTTGGNDITVPDRYAEAVIQYATHLAYGSVGDSGRAQEQLQNFRNTVATVTGTGSEPTEVPK